MSDNSALFTTLLSRLSSSLSNEDLAHLKKACPQDLRDVITQPEHFFKYLEDRGDLSSDNVIHLQRALETIARPDLVIDVMEYRKITSESDADIQITEPNNKIHEYKYKDYESFKDLLVGMEALELKPPPGKNTSIS